jgi:hypothetical protein
MFPLPWTHVDIFALNPCLLASKHEFWNPSSLRDVFFYCCISTMNLLRLYNDVEETSGKYIYIYIQSYGNYRRLVPRHYTAPIDRGFCNRLHSGAISVCTRYREEFGELLFKAADVFDRNGGLSTVAVGVTVFLFGRILTVLKIIFWIRGSQTFCAGAPRYEI